MVKRNKDGWFWYQLFLDTLVGMFIIANAVAHFPKEWLLFFVNIISHW